MEDINPLRFILAFVFVLGLIGLFAMLLKRYGAKQSLLGSSNETARLRVVETRYIDGKRKLVLVRRDETEHLLLLADGREVGRVGRVNAVLDRFELALDDRQRGAQFMGHIGHEGAPAGRGA